MLGRGGDVQLMCSHCSECYFHDDAGRWTKGFEENKGIGLMLASAAEGCVGGLACLLGVGVYGLSV